MSAHSSFCPHPPSKESSIPTRTLNPESESASAQNVALSQLLRRNLFPRTKNRKL